MKEAKKTRHVSPYVTVTPKFRHKMQAPPMARTFFFRPRPRPRTRGTADTYFRGYFSIWKHPSIHSSGKPKHISNTNTAAKPSPAPAPARPSCCCNSRPGPVTARGSRSQQPGWGHQALDRSLPASQPPLNSPTQGQLAPTGSTSG